jgi:hypothetical protein
MDKKRVPSDIERGADENANEGEGSKSADQNYRRDVDEFLENEDPSKLARQAQADVERDRDRYDEAERQGKARSAGDSPADKDLI